MRVMAALLSVFVLLLLGAAGDGKADLQKKYKDTIELIDELIQDEMDDEDIVGLSVALVDGREIVWAKGYGYSDKSRKVPAAPDTVYRLGSISELITSPAIMLLDERGLIDISQPLVKYLPEFSMKSRFQDSKPIKVSNLMSHHSGIQSELIKGEYSADPESFAVLLQRLKDEWVCYPPEFVFSFSKTGLSLLGIIIEKAAGKDFNEFVTENIFAPASMDSSSFVMNEKIKAKLSKGYDKEGKEVKIISTRDVPADGLMTSATDLANYMTVFFNTGKKDGKALFRPETVNRIMSSADPVFPLDLDLQQGCGWVLSCLGENLGYAGKIAWHDDSSGSFKGRIIALLDHKIGIVVISNTSSSMESVQMIAVEAIKAALEEKKGIKQPEWEEPDLDDTFSDSYMNSCAGDYATSAGVVTITRDGDDLSAEAMGRKFVLKPNTSKNFSGRIMLLGFIRLKVGPLSTLEFSFGNYNGKEIIALHRYGERFLVGEKIKPFKVSNAWQARLGSYNVVNAGTDLVYIKTIRLAYENGKMNAYYLSNDDDERERKVTIMPVTDTEAVILGLGRYMGETISVSKSDSGEQLKYSGYIFKKRK